LSIGLRERRVNAVMAPVARFGIIGG